MAPRDSTGGGGGVAVTPRDSGGGRRLPDFGDILFNKKQTTTPITTPTKKRPLYDYGRRLYGYSRDGGGRDGGEGAEGLSTRPPPTTPPRKNAATTSTTLSTTGSFCYPTLVGALIVINTISPTTSTN